MNKRSLKKVCENDQIVACIRQRFITLIPDEEVLAELAEPVQGKSIQNGDFVVMVTLWDVVNHNWLITVSLQKGNYSVPILGFWIESGKENEVFEQVVKLVRYLWLPSIKG